jgi:ferredoxin/flavodoxin
MKTNIYYFTGTGNSLAAARGLAARLDARLVPIASLVGHERIDAGSDAIGIVFPAYWGKVPAIVRNFASRLGGLKGKYLFAVGTCGGSLDSTRRSLERDLATGGGFLAASFLLRMPTNKFPPPAEKIARILALSEPKLDDIAEYVRTERSGRRETSSLAIKAIQIVLAPLDLAVGTIFAIKNGYAPFLPFFPSKRVNGMDRAFKVNGECDGCGACAQVCPVGNIAVGSGGPIWLHRCEQCFACLEWCPRGAIGASMSRGRYVHPDARVEDIVAQKGAKS